MSRFTSFSVLAFLTPVFVFAQARFVGTSNLIAGFYDIITALIIVATSIALLVFIWGLVKYIAQAGDAKAHEGGRSLMVNGAIALFVLFSIFGIIRWIGGEVGVWGTDNLPLDPPVIGGGSGGGTIEVVD